MTGRQCGKLTTKEGRGIELQIFLEVESPARNQGELGFDSFYVPFLKSEAGRRFQLQKTTAELQF